MARADPADGRYTALEEEAREARRGLHGPAPAAVAPPGVTVPDLTGDEPAGPDDAGASGG